MCNAGARGIPTKKGIRFRCRYKPLADMWHGSIVTAEEKETPGEEETEIYPAFAKNFLPLQRGSVDQVTVVSLLKQDIQPR